MRCPARCAAGPALRCCAPALWHSRRCTNTSHLVLVGVVERPVEYKAHAPARKKHTQSTSVSAYGARWAMRAERQGAGSGPAHHSQEGQRGRLPPALGICNGVNRKQLSLDCNAAGLKHAMRGGMPLAPCNHRVRGSLDRSFLVFPRAAHLDRNLREDTKSLQARKRSTVMKPDDLCQTCPSRTPPKPLTSRVVEVRRAETRLIR